VVLSIPSYGSYFVTMLSFLRHCRAMSLVLVLLAPGMSGTAVQWLHACPAQARQVADHQHHDTAPSQSQHSEDCRCIGSCSTTGSVTVPVRAVVLAIADIEPDQHVRIPAPASFTPSASPANLLPPATAPPLS